MENDVIQAIEKLTKEVVKSRQESKEFYDAVLSLLSKNYDDVTCLRVML